jgi:GT2 family glycosyltransferase
LGKALSPTFLIAIITFNRNAQLLRLLASIKVAVANGKLDGVDVLVINNGDFLEREPLGISNSGEITVINREINDLCLARNEAIDYFLSCNHDALIFVDDDEIVDGLWISKMAEFHKRSSAQIIAGPVLSILPPHEDRWVKTGVFGRKSFLSGSPLTDCATGNTLIRRELFEITGQNFRFDPRFSHLGGEDYAFSSAAVKSGARIEWCNEAVAYEFVTADRLNWDWVANRAKRTATVEFIVSNPNLAARFLFLASGLLRIAHAIPSLIFRGKFADSTYGNAFRRFNRGLAFVACSLNHNSVRDEY